MSGSSADQNKPGESPNEDAKTIALAAMEALYGDADVDEDDDDLEPSDQENEVEDDESETDEDESEGDADDESEEDEDEESEGDENADDDAENQETETERDVGFAKSKRFRQMNEQLKAAKSKAEKLEVIEQKLAAVGIEVDSLEEGLAVVAALKNPTAPGADKVLRPHLERIATVSGNGELDKDLQEDVSAGDLSEKRAREIQASRAREAYRKDAERETAGQRAQREAQEVIDGLYREFKSADPDFEKKRETMEALASREMMAFEAKNGRAPSFAQGAEIIRAAKAKIDALSPVRKVADKPESKLVPSSSKASKKPADTSSKKAEDKDGILSVIDRVMSKGKRSS